MELRRKNILTVSVSTPAPGAQFSVTVPALRQGIALWRILTVFFEGVTDATATTRDPAIVVDDGANVLAEVPAQEQWTASATRRQTFGRGQGAWTRQNNTSGDACSPLPDLWLREGYRVQSQVQSLQAGDQIQNIQMTVEEWG